MLSYVFLIIEIVITYHDHYTCYKKTNCTALNKRQIPKWSWYCSFLLPSGRVSSSFKFHLFLRISVGVIILRTIWLNRLLDLLSIWILNVGLLSVLRNNWSWWSILVVCLWSLLLWLRRIKLLLRWLLWPLLYLY